MSKQLMTSLDAIAKHEPCIEGWYAALKLRGYDECSMGKV